MANTTGLSILITAQNQASGAIDAVRSSLNGLASSARTTVNNGLEPIRNLLTTGLKVAAVGATAAIGGLVGLAGKSIALAAGFEQTEVAFGTMLGSADKAKQIMKDLFEFSAKTPFQFEEVSSAGKTLLAFGVSADDVKDTLRRLGDVAAGIGAPLGDIAEIYGKAKVQGKLFAEDINQLTGRGIPIIQALAKVLHVTDGEVKQMVSDGKVGFPELQKAFQGLTDQGGQFSGMMEAQSQTLSGLWSSLKDNVELALAGIGKTLVENLNLKDLLATATEWIGRFGAKIQELAATWIPFLVENVKALIYYIQAVVQDGDTMNDWLTHMAPALQTVVLKVVEFINWIKGAIQPIAELITRFVSWKDVAVAMAGIVAAIVLPALAGMVAAFAPVVAVIGGAIAIAAALRNAWEVNFGGIRTLVQALAAYLQERFGLLFAVVKDYGGGALSEILGWINGTETQFRNLSFIWQTIKTTAQLFFTDMVKYVQSNLPVWTAQLSAWGSAAWQWIANVTPVVLSKLADWGNALLGWVTNNLPTWIAKLASWGAAAWQWIVNVTPTLLGELGKWLGALLGWFGQQLPSFLAMLLRWGTALFTWIGDAIPRAIQGLVGLVTGMTNWGNSTGQQSLASMVVGWATTLIKWIAVDLIPTVGPELLKFGAAMVTTLLKVGLSLAEAALKLGVSIITAIAEGLLNLVGIGVNLSGVRDYLFSVITGWRQGLLAKGGEIVAALRDGLVAAQQWARDGINAVLDYLQSGNDQRLNSFGQALYGAGQGAIQKLGQGFQAAKDFAGSQIQQIMDDVQNRGVAFAAGAFAGRLYEAARNAMIQFGSGLMAGSPNLAGDLTRALEGLVNAFNWFMDPFKNHVYSSAVDIGTRIVNGLKAMNPVAAIQNTLGGLVSGFNQVMDPLKNHFYSAASDLANRIASGLGSVNMAGVVQGSLGGLVGAFNGFMDPLKNHVFSSASDLANRIATGLASMNPGETMRNGLHGIIDAFNGVMDGFKAHVYGVMQYIGGRISDGLADGIRGTIQTVLDALNWITSYAPQWVKDALGIHSPSTVFAAIGQNIMAGLAQGIEQMTATPQLAMAGATSGLVGAAAGATINNSRTTTTTNTFNVSGGNAVQDPFEATRVLNALYGS